MTEQSLVERVAEAIRDSAIIVLDYSDVTYLEDPVVPARAAIAEVIKAALYEVDKALENGSPRETWSEDEVTRDCARIEALEAINALAAEAASNAA